MAPCMSPSSAASPVLSTSKTGGGGVEERDQFAYQLEIGGSILSHRGGPTLLTASDERKGLSLVLVLSCPYFTRQILYGKL